MAMAMAHLSQRSSSLLAFGICLLIPCCFSSKLAMEMFERACHCFDDPNIYSLCAAEMRLNVEGAFHVQKDAVDEYCGGPCLEETTLALQCVEEMAYQSFRFSNGASVLAVKQALGTGCSYGPDRGTFEIRERKECVGGMDEYYYDPPRDHAQQKPVGGQYYGEGREQPYEQQQQQPQQQQGEGGDEEYCYGGAYGRVAHGGFSQLLLLLVASAALLLAL